ncbi:hypothetical protein C2845_PM03G04090 [Panicum miliaceum]|uniref:30S ribosomal protein S31, mitochondrial n=1 Tax=Panicum miliaceum TaxID=4540 RepID=A0A3L6TD79_PANMI|nr:hypothetical protein C2845_PM03G04090 [Panicum miliaceum]
MAMRLAAAAFMRRLAPARTSIPVPAAAAAPAAEAEAVTCGRGDKKTKRGKRFKGSYGNARPKREKKIERIKDRIEHSLSYWTTESVQSKLGREGLLNMHTLFH